MTSAAELERNKKIVRLFKECQGRHDEAAVMREILAPDYKRLRGGMANLAANAQGQSFPETLHGLRGAFPDRVDVIEDIIAEGDRVGASIAIEKDDHRMDLVGAVDHMDGVQTLLPQLAAFQDASTPELLEKFLRRLGAFQKIGALNVGGEVLCQVF